MQALGCARFGSLFYEALLNRAAEDIEARGPTLSLMSPWANATRKEVIADASHLGHIAASTASGFGYTDSARIHCSERKGHCRSGRLPATRDGSATNSKDMIV